MGIDSEKIGRVILEQPGVESYHHLHIWALSTTETALTAHIVIGDLRRMEEVKREVKHELEHVGITHATLEFEYKGACCEGEIVFLKVYFRRKEQFVKLIFKIL